MFKQIICLCFTLFCVVSNFAQNFALNKLTSPYINPTLKFTENIGQWNSSILFRAQLDGGALYIENDGLTFSFYNKIKYRSIHHGGVSKGIYKDFNIPCHAYKIKFQGANSPSFIKKEQAGSDYENFFIGNDPQKWKGQVKNYHQVTLNSIYNGIDYEVLTSASGVKYNFHVAPNKNPNNIKLSYEGVKDIKLKDDILYVKLDVNEVIEQKPYAYQNINGSIKEVPCHYKFKDKVLSFEFPEDYNHEYSLIIDPVLIFAAQSGSTADNFGMTATYDASGNLYSGGTIFDNGYPTTLGVFSTSFTGSVSAGITDLVITKYNALGNALIYSTYLGGSQAEIVTSLITDGSNNLYLYGATSSTNFPMPLSTFDNTFNGGSFLSFQFNGTTFNNGTDIFVAKLNSTGSSLLGATYMGGSANDGVNYNNFAPQFHTVYPCSAPSGISLVNEYPADSLQYNYGDQYRGEIQLDKNGFVYVTSSTKSNNFPVLNAFQNSLSGVQDAVVFKLNSNLSSLVWSSYLGGSGNDAGYSLIVDDTLQTYVTGGTYSSNFPVVSGCYQTSAGGGKADGYLAKINAAGNQILKATYIGTASYDQSYFVQSDRIGRIYVFGQSLGSMSVSPGVYSNAGSHQFIMRFNNQLTNLNLSTVIGSTQASLDISPSAFCVDKCSGSISLSGWGGSIINCSNLSGMPVTVGAFQSSPPNGHDFYLMVLYPNFSGLKYGSYFGGSLSDEHVDGGTSRINEQGVLFQSVCAGCGGNDDFPVTPGAWPNSGANVNHSSNCNNGVFKFNYEPRVKSAIGNSSTAGCSPITVTLSNLGSPGVKYLWNFGGGINDTTSQIINPVKTFSVPGNYTVTLLLVENQFCFYRDSSQIVIQVIAPPNATLNLNTTLCSNTVNLSQISTGVFGPNPFLWNFGNGVTTNSTSTPFYTYPSNGIYTISLTATDIFSCTVVKTITVSVFNFTPSVISNTSICQGALITLTATGGNSYSWSPSSTLNNSLIASPLANPTTNIIYTVNILNNSSGYNCIKTLTTQVLVNPKPNASFSLSNVPCSNSIAITNNSSGNFGAIPFSWNFGNGSPINNFFAPTYFYPLTGTYTVSLLATDLNGCSSLASQTISILNFSPTVINSASICNGASYTLNSSGGNSYTWMPVTGLNLNTIPNPIANPSISTIYSVNILNNTFGFNCTKSLTTQIIVNPKPTSNFSFSANPCGGSVSFFDLSYDDVEIWRWTLTPLITSTLQNPYNYYSNGGTYTVSLVVTNSFGCKDKIDKIIQVKTPPVLSVSNHATICIGAQSQLMASGGISYQWFPNQSLDFPSLYNPNASPNVTTDYSVVITTSNSIAGNPCQYTLVTRVNVEELSILPIKVNANPPLVLQGNSSTLSYIGSAGVTIVWYPLNTTVPAVGYTVIAQPNLPTTYTAMIVKGPCFEKVLVYVDIYKDDCLNSDFFIPNTFTPNGDQQNDMFLVRGLKVDLLSFAIYNRWGEMVFESNDINKGWDGTYKNKPADVGVFGWYLKVKCIGGKETFKKGNVTLIR